MSKRYFVEYKSAKFDKLHYDPDTGEYGSYWHFYGNASTLRTAKNYISKIRRERADENISEFRIYDSWGDCAPDEHVPCVYREVV